MVLIMPKLLDRNEDGHKVIQTVIHKLIAVCSNKWSLRVYIRTTGTVVGNRRPSKISQPLGQPSNHIS